MAKGNNNVKPKRSHLYKPYDSANSSLVARLTSRVSEILPQPSSWLSRWLTPGDQSSFHNESEENDAEQLPPPTKKLRKTNDNSVLFNHVYNQMGNDNELSPILRNRSDHLDGAIPGPSGLHLRGVNFVASTPAVPVASAANDPSAKINGGDEGSDGSESTSGCSSLVPQGERTLTAPFEPNIKMASLETPKVSSARNSFALNNSRQSLKSKNHAMNSSISSPKSRPSFDAYVFNNPLNKSLSFNSTLHNTLEDSLNSSFYRGRTMYGGNASCKESLNLSLTSPKVGTPKVVSVRPTPNLSQSRETISTSALKILRAIEQFSSPVVDTKKIPVKSESERRKRKAVQPFEDLVIPTVPDLLRIKRKQRIASEPSTPSTPSTVSTPKPYHLPPPVQPLSVREDVSEPKRVMKVKNAEEMKSERVEKVALPSVPLPITSLPSFTLTSLPSTPSVPSTPAPTPTLNTLPPPTPPVTSTFSFAPIKKPITVSPSFKFSSPILENTDDSTIVGVQLNLKFRPPLGVDSVDAVNREGDEALSQASNKSENSTDLSRQGKSNSAPRASFLFESKPNKPVEPPLGKFAPVLKTLSKEKPEGSSEWNSKAEPQSGFGDKFKAASGSWTCSSCLVPNTPESTKCCCCETPKSDKKECPKLLSMSPQNDKLWSCSQCSYKNKETTEICVCGLKRGEKPVSQPLSKSLKDFAQNSSESWECKECFVSNKKADKACVACSSPQPGVASSKAAVPLSEMFKKPPDTWECSVCMVGNESRVTACVACGTLKPGATPAPKTTPSFSFGMPPASKTPAAPATAATTSSTLFKFGAPSTMNEKKTEAPQSSFIFGIPPSTSKVSEECKEKPKTASPSVASALSVKVSEETASDGSEKPPKKKVSFCEPSGEEQKRSGVVKQNEAPVFSLGTTSATKTEPSTTFLLPNAGSKRSPFGSTSVVASSSTDAKSSLETLKFRNSSTGVSSSTDPATTSRALPPKTPSAAPPNLFSGTPSSKPVFLSQEKKPEAPPFGAPPTNTLFPPSNLPDSKPLGIETASAPSTADTSKNSIGKSIFGVTETKPPLFGHSSMSDQSTTSFFNATESKGGFFNSESSESKNIFGGTASTDKWNKPNFGASNSLFDMKPAATVNNIASTFTASPATAAPTVFGSQTAILNSTEPKPVAFGAVPSATNPIHHFMFKGKEVTPNANPSGFTFSAPTPAPPSNAFNFNSDTNFGAPQQNSQGMGSSQPTPVFGTPAAPAPVFNNPPPNPTTTPFAFGAQQNEQQFAPTFGFSAPQQPQAAAPAFSFNVPNSAPAQPPTFDPNIKPSFNFTGGAPTPTFGAPPAAGSVEMPERKIRRAVRRTQPR